MTLGVTEWEKYCKITAGVLLGIQTLICLMVVFS